jgi:acyl-CoA thioester hydrolase
MSHVFVSKDTEQEMQESEVRTRVRYGETDQMGVVYHSNYFLYFELGRTEYMRQRGYAYADLERQGIFLAVVEANCKYKAGAKYDDPIIIRTSVGKTTNVTIMFQYQVFREQDNVLLVEGSTTLACLNKDNRPQRIPEEIARALAADKA